MSQINNIINHFMKSNLTIKISNSFNVGYIFDTKKTSMVVYVLKFKYLPLNHPCFNQFFLFRNMLYTNKDTIHHTSHKWAFKWQQFIPTSSLNSFSAFITLK